MPELFIPLVFSGLLFVTASFVVIPGLPVMLFLLILSFLFAVVDGFVRLAPSELLILVAVYLFSFLVDFFSGVLGAKYGGASFRSLGFGILGAVLGAILLPPFGAFLGLFFGVLISEYISRGDHRHAIKAASYGILGVAVGILINIALAIAFLASFVTFVFLF